MPTYSVIIKDGSSILWEFDKASQIQWERYENKVGVARFLVPRTDFKLSPTSVALGKHEFRIYRDGLLVWQGLVMLTEDNKDGTFIYGLDLMEVLKWYQIGKDVKYTTKKIGTEIISPIWNAIAARSNAALGSLITKGTIEDPYQTGTSTPKTISKTTFDEDFFSLLQEMIAISRAGSPQGAWKQDTVFDISLSETAPTFTFLKDVGVDQPDARFELDSEITNFTIVDDARFIRNDVKGIAVTSDPKVIKSQQVNTTSRNTYYLREISPLFNLIGSTADLSSKDVDLLEERTKDYLNENEKPDNTIAIQFASGLVPFNGYSMGDAVQLIINRGRVSINEFYRVVGMLVKLEAGIELTVPRLERKRT